MRKPVTMEWIAQLDAKYKRAYGARWRSDLTPEVLHEAGLLREHPIDGLVPAAGATRQAIERELRELAASLDP